MFGHACEEPISLVTPHPCNFQVAICTTKLNLTILDILKNRSIRNFSIKSTLPKEAQPSSKTLPLGLFFTDNIACRAYQSILLSTIQQLPSSSYLCLVLPKGIVSWDITTFKQSWTPFDFVANSVTQTPDSLIIGDNSHTLYIYSLINGSIKVFATTSGTPNYLFTSSCGGVQFGIVSFSSLNVIEFFSSSGKLASKLQAESIKNIAFDVYSGTLFTVDDKRTVSSYSITPLSISKVGECGFSNLSFNDSKPTNYNIQQICPCRLPITSKPLFFAICEQCTLLLGGPSKVIQKVSSFPANKKIKKLNCTSMKAHPTELPLFYFVSDNQLIVIDIFSHLPHIMPSLPIPAQIQKSSQVDGIYNVTSNEEITCVMNYSTLTYTISDNKTNKIIATNNALFVVIGPRNRYAHFIKEASRKHKEISYRYYIQVFEGTSLHKKIHVVPPKDIEYPLRLFSFGDEYFALIFGHSILDTSFNLQSQGQTTAFVYHWDTLNQVGVQIENSTNIVSSPPLLAIASPNEYAVYDISNGFVEKCRRQKRAYHMKFYEGKLYLLTHNGLEIDNFKTIELVSSRFSHELTKEKNATLIPMNALIIKEIYNGSVTVLDNFGKATTIGIPEEEMFDDGVPLIVNVALSNNPIEAASSAFQSASENEKKQMMLMMMRTLGWDAVEPVLSKSELAIAEYSMNAENTDYRDSFNEYLKTELEIDE